MVYATHPKNTSDLVRKLAMLLAFVPEDEVDQLLTKAREESPKYYPVRQNNDYGYKMINLGNELLKEGKIRKVFSSVLLESNHGHSGFTESTDRIYKNPRNEEEKKVSQLYWKLHVNALTQFLKTAEPVADVFGDYMDTEVASDLLLRLGANAPQELVDGMKKHLQGCCALDPDNKTSALRIWNHLNIMYD